MSTSCSDVCTIVHERLLELGFEFDDDENHDDIIEAMCKTTTVRDRDLEIMKDLYALLTEIKIDQGKMTGKQYEHLMVKLKGLEVVLGKRT